MIKKNVVITWDITSWQLHTAVRIIFGKPYDSYTQTLKDLDMVKLSERRDLICLKFAKNCLKIENFKKLFPVHKNLHDMETRQHEKYRIVRSFSKRYGVSAIPNMQKLLNKEHKKHRKALKSLLSPTNYACKWSYCWDNKPYYYYYYYLFI